MSQGHANQESNGSDGEIGTGSDGGVNLEERLRRVDEIVTRLEGGDVELEEGLQLFEEGVRHIREAEALLSHAELRVEELIGDAGEMEVHSPEAKDV